jgi:hypothetical protein
MPALARGISDRLQERMQPIIDGGYLRLVEPRPKEGIGNLIKVVPVGSRSASVEG